MQKEVKLSYLVFWYSIAFLATSLFLYGFFPIKTSSSYSVQDPPSFVDGLKVDAINLYKPQIERLVIVVIDALRMDFVREELMPLLMSEIRKTDGCVLQLKADTPTVTMPRIKAITTGSIPQYIDLALNIISPEINDDSILLRLRKLNKNIVFYGDNTWMKLYPNIFLRSEGVTSFNVNDFSEVDTNVTRNLPNELKKKDWHVMILHYLGLDHIGHVHGPFSPLIKAKLAEMDKIIEFISKALQTDKKTPIIITSDHGMRDGGSHGGSSKPEIEVPLAWIGRCAPGIDRKHRQIDLASTLSTLFAVPIPANSVGSLIPQLLTDNNTERVMYAHYYNAMHLIGQNENRYISSFERCIRLHKLALNGSQKHREAIKCYEEKSSEVSDQLIKKTSEQIVPYLIISCAILSWCLLASIFPTKHKLYLVSLIISSTALITEKTTLETTKLSVTLSTILLVISIVLSLSDIERAILHGATENIYNQIFGFAHFIGILCMISSSFVEEEHQIWLFYFSSFALFMLHNNEKGYRDVDLRWFALLVFVRFVRDLNRVGDQSSFVPDISNWLQKPENNIIFYILFFVGLISIGVCQILNSKSINKSIYIYGAALISILMYRIKTDFLWPRICYGLLLAYALLERKAKIKMLVNVLSAVLALLLRPWNLLLIPAFQLGSHCIIKHSPSVFVKVIAHLWLAKVFYNGQGNDNSIGSVDVAAGYIGLTGDNFLLAGIQLLIHRYAFPILAQILLISSFRTNGEQKQAIRINMVLSIFNMLYVCIVSIVFKSHLFVWSVFSPKLLLEAVQLFVMFCIVNIYLIIKSF